MHSSIIMRKDSFSRKNIIGMCIAITIRNSRFGNTLYQCGSCLLSVVRISVDRDTLG